MYIKSKAPLRLGIGGGGTDVCSYYKKFGGNVLNATIDLYSTCILNETNETNENKIIFEAVDLGIREELGLDSIFKTESKLILHQAVLKKILSKYSIEPKPFKLSTHVDVPAGSGLGSSSTLVVSMIEAFRKYFSLPLKRDDIAHLAYEIERIDCGLNGGKQDQYAAVFGGFNFIEFKKNDSVIVNPLKISRDIIDELESSLILYFSGVSRSSAKIIEDQMNSISDKDKLTAMHKVKESATEIKQELINGDINNLAMKFKQAWEAKKGTSNSITNDKINEVESILDEKGVNSLKVSGAGGGGFIMIFVDPKMKLQIMQKLKNFGGYVQKFKFVSEGCKSWSAKEIDE